MMNLRKTLAFDQKWNIIIFSIMKISHGNSCLNYWGILLSGILFILSCQTGKPEDPKLNSADSIRIRDSVNVLAAGIARDVSAKGPSAWLDYFEDTPDFFMVSDGRLVFPDHQTAKDFIQNTLVKNIRRISLHWNNIRIAPLTAHLASMGANFHEELTDAGGKSIFHDGYFTGLAIWTDQGWQLRNAHWSTLKPQ